MRLMIVRHGDPDYVKDSLTERGWKEAEYLSQWLKDIPAVAYYVSPLGRARDTASCTLSKVGKEATVCNWLREFDPPVKRPNSDDQESIAWDWLPQDWSAEDCFYDAGTWYEHPTMLPGHVKEAYREVTDGLDALLAKHGYVRSSKLYRAENANNDTVILFCHFGLECVLLSHLLNISPMVLWHGTCAAPSSITTLYTEERRPGIACFRMQQFGGLPHLAVNGMEPAFAGRFCEKYGNPGERCD